MRNFLFLMAAIGTIVPWLFFGEFIATNGLDIVTFVTQPFVNSVASGITADLLISSAVFWAWSSADARERGVANWWVVIPATLLVGLSLALPLYLIMRESRTAPAHA